MLSLKLLTFRLEGFIKQKIKKHYKTLNKKFYLEHNFYFGAQRLPGYSLKF